MPGKKFLLGILIAFPLIIGAGCNEPSLVSVWRAQTLESFESRWENAKRYSIEDKPVIFGIQNDGEYLYIYISPSENSTRLKIERNGLTIWLDSNAGKDKEFGIHYPLGATRPGMPPNEKFPRDRAGPGMVEPREFGRNFPENDTLEILFQKEQVRIPFGNDLGLTVSRQQHNEIVNYEYAIPLKLSNSTPYAIDADTGQTISIGFEIGERKGDARERGRGRKDGMRGGGFGGPGDGGPPGPGGMDRPRGPGRQFGDRKDEMNDSKMEIWIKVKLAGCSKLSQIKSGL